MSDDGFVFNGKEYKCSYGKISIHYLNFDLDNDPRFYRCKNQEDAYQELTRLEDHFLLSQKMVKDGGMRESILARQKDKSDKLTIIDGHMRLAVLKYLYLSENEKVNWAEAKVQIIHNIDDEAVTDLKKSIQSLKHK